jgi:diketogulonate reductase-like aldo/keto reductase
MADVPSSVTLLTGYSLPTIGFGVYQLDDCPGGVANALKIGYRHIDCAQFYDNEADVGEGVRSSGIPRDQVFITSKVQNAGYGYEETLKSVEESVKKLGFSYYDLFLLHSPHGGRDARLARYKAVLEAKARGLVRTAGVSNFSEKHIKEIEEAGLEKPAVNQIEVRNNPHPEYRPNNDYVVSSTRGANSARLRCSASQRGSWCRRTRRCFVAPRHQREKGFKMRSCSKSQRSTAGVPHKF